MTDHLTADPVATVKWVAIFFGVAALYFQLRAWERRISGKIEKIEIQQPVEIVPGQRAVTQETLAPVIHRVSVLENEVRVIRCKMDSDKQEILARIDQLESKTSDGFRSLERAIGRLEGTKP